MDKRGTSEKRLCRLCGKQKEEKDFLEIILTVIGKKNIRYRGCNACDIVIHNASVLTREMILQEARKLNVGKV